MVIEEVYSYYSLKRVVPMEVGKVLIEMVENLS